jgi:hypothetical protein
MISMSSKLHADDEPIKDICEQHMRMFNESNHKGHFIYKALFEELWNCPGVALNIVCGGNLEHITCMKEDSIEVFELRLIQVEYIYRVALCRQILCDMVDVKMDRNTSYGLSFLVQITQLS